MAIDEYFYQPAEGHGLPHDPFNALVAPRPIGWISSRSNEGVANLAPYSFFNAFNYTPPIIGFSSVGYKDSVRNIEATQEFAWNLATQPLAKAMNLTSASVAGHIDEFELAGLATAPCRLINVQRVAESPVTLECRLAQLLRLHGADGHATNSWLVLGEVVGVHIARHLLVDGVYDTAAAQPITRGGGPADYFTIEAANRFQMIRPD